MTTRLDVSIACGILSIVLYSPLLFLLINWLVEEVILAHLALAIANCLQANQLSFSLNHIHSYCEVDYHILAPLPFQYTSILDVDCNRYMQDHSNAST